MTSETTTSFVISTSPYVKELVERLLPFAEMKKIPARKKLFLTVGNEKFCYLLTTGKATLQKEESNLLLATLQAPTLIGPGQIEEHDFKLYVKLLTSCDVGVIPLKRALEVIDEQNLWKLLSQHTALLFNKLYAINQQLTAPTAYAQVKAQLRELMSEDKSIRNSISAERYIRDKTNLSRSGIMRILSALKEGGYIEVSRGFLLKVNSLPERF